MFARALTPIPDINSRKEEDKVKLLLVKSQYELRRILYRSQCSVKQILEGRDTLEVRGSVPASGPAERRQRSNCTAPFYVYATITIFHSARPIFQVVTSYFATQHILQRTCEMILAYVRMSTHIFKEVGAYNMHCHGISRIS